MLTCSLVTWVSLKAWILLWDSCCYTKSITNFFHFSAIWIVCKGPGTSLIPNHWFIICSMFLPYSSVVLFSKLETFFLILSFAKLDSFFFCWWGLFFEKLNVNIEPLFFLTVVIPFMNNNMEEWLKWSSSCSFLWLLRWNYSFGSSRSKLSGRDSLSQRRMSLFFCCFSIYLYKLSRR